MLSYSRMQWFAVRPFQQRAKALLHFSLVFHWRVVHRRLCSGALGQWRSIYSRSAIPASPAVRLFGVSIVSSSLGLISKQYDLAADRCVFRRQVIEQKPSGRFARCRE